MSRYPVVDRPRLGISACLLGEEVRFNGGHKRSALCAQTLAEHVEFVPLCPEMAIGLGTPRQPIRLVGDPAAPHARGTVDTALDVTDALARYGREVAESLQGVSGYILMQKSPSCGMERVKVYQDNGYPAEGGGTGVFARALMDALPDLPVEEDGRLHDPVLRENFLTRVYAYANWQRLCREGLTRRGVLAYHAGYKYQLMAHHPAEYKALGRLLGAIADQPLEVLAPQYFARLMAALRRPATRGTHSNVLQHLSGYLKRDLDGADRAEIQRLIGQYRDGIVPLVVPLTLLKHHLRKHPDPYLAGQAYLQPHPEVLSLRNAI